MSKISKYNDHTELTYRIRIMGGIALTELILLVIVLFWPVQGNNTVYQTDVKDKNTITLQTPVITRQQSSPPPPPRPQTPIPVPNDQVVIDEKPIPDVAFSESFDSLSVTAGRGGQGNDKISGNPDTPPRVQRIQEPPFKNLSPEKADIYINFLVGKKGDVEEVTIEKIFLYDKDGKPTLQVAQIDEDVLSKVITAAYNWKFRPATKNGKPVRAYKTGIFTVDY